MNDETAVQPQPTAPITPASQNDKEKEIQQLLNEKKALEEKNKRLASILEITAKNVSKLKAMESTPEKTETKAAATAEVVSQVASIKKEIGTLERKIEKSKTVQSSEQLNTVISEIKTHFEKVDERLNILDKVITLEKKLGDIEDSITLRKKSSSNLFGGLGTIGGGTPEGAVNENDSSAETGNAEDDFGKLDEINLKIDSIMKKLENLPAAEKHSISDSLKKMISGGDSEERKYHLAVQQKVNESSKTDDTASGDVSGITFRKIDSSEGTEGSNSNISFRSSMKGIESPEGADIRFKIHTPEHFSDFRRIPDDIRDGHVVLLNVKALKDESIDELRHFVERIKRISDGISSKIMGIGEHHIIILPKKINLHQDENKQ